MYNRRLSGSRTVMSENIYGTWKRRFPISKAMRTDLELGQKIIVATGILFNISRIWKGEGPEDDSDSEDDSEDEGSENRMSSHASVTVEEGDPGSVRIRGQAERERLKDNMPLLNIFLST